MAMKFVRKILENVGLKTGYGLAKRMTEEFGEYYSTQKVSNWLGQSDRDQKGINLTDLCRLRKLSKRGWDEFGADLDNEFLK